jgi:hypothetical protein
MIAGNALVSVAGALATSARQAWVLTPVGLMGFAAWNVLLAAIALCFALAWRARLRSGLAA